jgi:DNA-binding NarL/FixJ family response regulator
MTRTRVLVADAASIFRTAVHNLLVREGDFDVLEATESRQVLDLVAQRNPEIALIDSELPPDGAVAVVRRLSGTSETHIVVWSFSPTRNAVVGAIRAGADGYLHKEISPRGLVRSLRGMVAGEAPLARDLAALMIDGLHGLERQASARERATSLSARERQVLALIASGARNKDIATHLFISEFTVKRHVQNILQKLDLTSRHAAARFYRAAFEGDGVPEAIGRSA